MDNPFRSLNGNAPFVNAVQEKSILMERWNAGSGISSRDDASALQFYNAGTPTSSNSITNATPASSCLTESVQQVRGSVRALHRFKSTIGGELGFEKGDIITVLARESEYEDWWYGELNRQRGIFPTHYVEEMSNFSPIPSRSLDSQQTSNYGKDTTWVRALYTFVPSEDEDLGFTKGDVITVISRDYKDWWRGRLDGVPGIFPVRMGFFPTNYVEELPNRPSGPAPQLVSRQNSRNEGNPTLVRAVHSYIPSEDEELGFTEGDIITVVRQDCEDWWTGRVNGRTGIFPATNYVEELEVSERITNLSVVTPQQHADVQNRSTSSSSPSVHLTTSSATPTSFEEPEAGQTAVDLQAPELFLPLTLPFPASPTTGDSMSRLLYATLLSLFANAAQHGNRDHARSYAYGRDQMPVILPLDTPALQFYTALQSNALASPPFVTYGGQISSPTPVPTTDMKSTASCTKEDLMTMKSDRLAFTDPFHTLGCSQEADKSLDDSTFDDILLPGATAGPDLPPLSPHCDLSNRNHGEGPRQATYINEENLDRPETPPYQLYSSQTSAQPPLPAPTTHDLGVTPSFAYLRQAWSHVGAFICHPLSQSKRYDHTFKSSHSCSSKDGYSKADVKFLIGNLFGQIYWHLLLRMPSLYFSRVARIFEEAELTLPEIKKMALETATANDTHEDLHRTLDADVTPPQYTKLKKTWEFFIDSVMREWKTFNVISVLLLSAILTILQIDGAAEDPITRFSALSSLLCASMSLLFGCMYIIRFGTMRKTYKAAEWALEAKRTKTAVWWNIWILLAMPVIWLTWSIILYIMCIMSFIWRTGSPDATPPNPLPPMGLLVIRMIITSVLGLGIIYGCLVVLTFRRYGEVMDRAWKQRIDGWLEEKATASKLFTSPTLDYQTLVEGLPQPLWSAHQLDDASLSETGESVHTAPSANTRGSGQSENGCNGRASSRPPTPTNFENSHHRPSLPDGSSEVDRTPYAEGSDSDPEAPSYALGPPLYGNEEYSSTQHAFDSVRPLDAAGNDNYPTWTPYSPYPLSYRNFGVAESRSSTPDPPSYEDFNPVLSSDVVLQSGPLPQPPSFPVVTEKRDILSSPQRVSPSLVIHPPPRWLSPIPEEDLSDMVTMEDSISQFFAHIEETPESQGANFNAYPRQSTFPLESESEEDLSDTTSSVTIEGLISKCVAHIEENADPRNANANADAYPTPPTPPPQRANTSPRPGMSNQNKLYQSEVLTELDNSRTPSPLECSSRSATPSSEFPPTRRILSVNLPSSSYSFRTNKVMNHLDNKGPHGFSLPNTLESSEFNNPVLENLRVLVEVPNTQTCSTPPSHEPDTSASVSRSTFATENALPGTQFRPP